jgi:hypothetical protein
MTELNKRIAELPIPDRMAGFPLSDEGYPIPYFVPFIGGRPEFRAMDPEKFAHAVRNRRCWLCGSPLGKHLTFPIGPMCAISRTTAEPPSHLECCEYAVRACPFLSQPRMRRNEQDLPENAGTTGIAIKRNPGVTVLWTTKSYKLFSAAHEGGGKGYLFRIGDPEHVECYALGLKATEAQLARSIITGYPILQATAALDGPEAEEELEHYYARALRVLGLSPELMYTIEKELASEDHRSGNGGTAGGTDAVNENGRGGPGASTQSAPQPQRGPEVLNEQGGGGPGHPVQEGITDKNSDTLAQSSGGRDGLLAKGARRVQVGSQRVAAGAMAVYRKIHSAGGPD